MGSKRARFQNIMEGFWIDSSSQWLGGASLQPRSSRALIRTRGNSILSLGGHVSGCARRDCSAKEEEASMTRDGRHAMRIPLRCGRTWAIVALVSTIGVASVDSMPLKRGVRVGLGRQLLQEGSGAATNASNDDDGGVPTKLLIGVLVPVGVLLIVLAVAIYKYSHVFRQSRDSSSGGEVDKEGVRADGGVSAEVGFHDANGSFQDANGGSTPADANVSSTKFVAMDGGQEKGLGLVQKLKKTETEKKRGSKSAHPGIGLGSVFGDTPQADKSGDGKDSEGRGGEGKGEEQITADGNGIQTVEAPQKEIEEEDLQEEQPRLKGGAEAGGQVKAEGGEVLGEERRRLPADANPTGEGEDDQSPGSASKAPTEKEAGEGFAQHFSGITALGTQPVQVWQDAPFAQGVVDPAAPPPDPAPANHSPAPAPQPPLPAPAGGRGQAAAGPERAGAGAMAASSSGTAMPPGYAPRPLPAVPHPGMQRGGPGSGLGLGLDVTGLSVPSEPDSPPPTWGLPATHSVAGLYSRVAEERQHAPPLIINGMGQQVGARSSTLPPSVGSAQTYLFTPETSPLPVSSTARLSPGLPGSRFSPGSGTFQPGYGRTRPAMLPSRDPRRRRIMNLHKEMFGGSEGEGMTKPVELPGDKGISFYQGRSSLAGRMAYSSIEFGTLPKAPYVPPGGMRDEDEMWG